MIYRHFFGTPTMGYRSPFSQLERMRNQMDRLMEGLSRGEGMGRAAGVFPHVNLTEDTNNYFIRAELPGITGEDLNIQAERSSISLSGERSISQEKEKVKYHRKEREAGTFSRVISLPGEIDPEKVGAGLKDGVLTITLPKAESAKPKQIAVN